MPSVAARSMRSAGQFRRRIHGAGSGIGARIGDGSILNVNGLEIKTHAPSQLGGYFPLAVTAEVIIVFFMRVIVIVTVCIASSQAIADETKKYLVRETKDDITGKIAKSIAVTGEDNKSSLLLTVSESGLVSVGVAPADTISPDKADVTTKKMHVWVTVRSTAMDEPITKNWSMGWMKYGVAISPFTPEEAKQMFAGDFLTVQFDTTGDRCRFVTSGEGFDQLDEDVAKLLAEVPALQQERARQKQAAQKQDNGDSSPTKTANPFMEADKQKKPTTISGKVARARADGEEFGKQKLQYRKWGPDLDKEAAAAATRKGYKTNPTRGAFIEGYRASMGFGE